MQIWPAYKIVKCVVKLFDLSGHMTQKMRPKEKFSHKKFMRLDEMKLYGFSIIMHWIDIIMTYPNASPLM
jgi:hypothetical protein